MDATIQLLKDLTEAHGVPGNEGPIREVVRGYLGPLGELSQDKIGSLICRKPGGADAPRLMLAGHMDEVGFMVRLITKEGFLKFIPLGGWFSQVLQGQRVIVKTHKGDVVGVIGAKPVHILSPEERNKIVPLKDMTIDVGATSQEEVIASGVRVNELDATGTDISRRLFHLDGKELRTRATMVPIMMTTDAVIARADCLFYAAHRRQ